MTEREDRMPLAQERLLVDKRWSETGRVRVRTTTETVPHLVREELRGEAVEVARVPVDYPVDAAPDIRVEGRVTIVPVVEERLVVERRLFVIEEIHLRRVETRTSVEEEVLLRRQQADVEREETGGDKREE